MPMLFAFMHYSATGDADFHWTFWKYLFVTCSLTVCHYTERASDPDGLGNVTMLCDETPTIV